jgi:hypothetical protein
MPASADPSQKLNHDAIAMARFFSGLLKRMLTISTVYEMPVAPSTGTKTNVWLP